MVAESAPHSETHRNQVLAINRGSSSIKFAIFDDHETKLTSGTFERLQDSSTHESEQLFDWLKSHGHLAKLAAVGHRVVHGGPDHFEPEVVTPQLVEELKKIVPLDPAHLPSQIALIEGFARLKPDLPQFVCYDTQFHHTLPRVAQMLPIPRRYFTEGIRRYGFHGLSYAFLLEELERIGGAEEANGRILFAHLGNGASMAAVRGKKCLDTTMALTPTAGLVMGKRSGDLDPGLMVHLMRTEKLTAETLDTLVNEQSGMLGISETSADVRDLLERQESDHRAADAIDLFCYQAKKWIGALAAVLGGVDTLVFSGGIGENSPVIRARICEGLGFLGLQIDLEQNAQNQPLLSTESSRCRVRVLRTDEERMIARTAHRLF
jgi:acetate kinase